MCELGSLRHVGLARAPPNLARVTIARRFKGSSLTPRFVDVARQQRSVA